MTDEFGDMRTAYGKALTELGEQDKNIVVLGATTTNLNSPSFSDEERCLHSNKSELFFSPNRKSSSIFFLFFKGEGIIIFLKRLRSQNEPLSLCFLK